MATSFSISPISAFEITSRYQVAQSQKIVHFLLLCMHVCLLPKKAPIETKVNLNDI
jgi:uncharacterized membrane protein